jgi:hypothetical protein
MPHHTRADKGIGAPGGAEALDRFVCRQVGREFEEKTEGGHALS